MQAGRDSFWPIRASLPWLIQGFHLASQSQMVLTLTLNATLLNRHKYEAGGRREGREGLFSFKILLPSPFFLLSLFTNQHLNAQLVLWTMANKEHITEFVYHLWVIKQCWVLKTYCRETAENIQHNFFIFSYQKPFSYMAFDWDLFFNLSLALEGKLYI